MTEVDSGLPADPVAPSSTRHGFYRAVSGCVVRRAALLDRGCLSCLAPLVVSGRGGTVVALVAAVAPGAGAAPVDVDTTARGGMQTPSLAVPWLTRRAARAVRGGSPSAW